MEFSVIGLKHLPFGELDGGSLYVDMDEVKKGKTSHRGCLVLTHRRRVRKLALEQGEKTAVLSRAKSP